MGLRGKLEGKALKGKINKLVELRGYSAYEVAALNGFEGTAEEWLSSLEGKPGKDGTDGEPGVNGITPHIGNNGNWFIGETDTGMPSRGEDGQDGHDGYTPVKVTVTQQSDGTYTAEDWTAAKILDAHNTGHTVYCQWGNRVLSLLVASKPFCAFGCVHSENVYTVTITAATVTVTTTPLASGSGADGITPHIGANGNWWIGDEDTGVKAAGGGGTSGIHIGSEPPTDENAVLWINPEGEPADFVPTPSTASIGQTIVVKEVDENGKPTEWEAADFPPGGGGGSQNFSTVLTSDAAYRKITVPLPVNLGKALIFNVHVTFPSVETELNLVGVFGKNFMQLETIPVNSKEVGLNLYAVRHTENIYNSGTTTAKDYTYAACPILGAAGWLISSLMDNTISIYTDTDGVDLPAGTKIEVWGICE